MGARINRALTAAALGAGLAAGVAALPGPAATAQPPRGGAVDTVPEKMGNRIRRVLRETHHARMVERGAARVAHPDGRSTVFGLYEYSAMAACLHRARAAGEDDPRAHCREAVRRTAAGRAGGDGGYEAPIDPDCTVLRVVRADVAAPGAGRPAGWGGAIEITADVELPGFGCALDALEAFVLRDVDEDGHLEVEVRATSHTTLPGTWRYPDPTRAGVQNWVVLDGRALATQLALDRGRGRYTPADYAPSDQEGDEREPPTFRAVRYRLEDADEDGHVDVIEERQAYRGRGRDQASPCALDSEGWPVARGPRRCSPLGAPTRRVWRYDPGADRFVEP